ncbi:putative double-stranded RNA-binding domain-containing protein [Septoria linicola]|nr:putative double-stranded RNA-binding domain-containing protein [Septoria linicola]
MSESEPFSQRTDDASTGDSGIEPLMPDVDRRAYHARCAWLGRHLCTSLLAETVFRDASDSCTGTDLDAGLQAAFIDFPYYECFEKIDGLKTFQVDSSSDGGTEDMIKTFMTKVGLIVDQGDSDMRRRLSNLIQSRGTSTLPVRGIESGPPSPPASIDADLHAEIPLAFCTMRLQEWCTKRGKSVEYEGRQLNLDPVRWEMTCKVDGTVHTAHARTKGQAKHIASKNACEELGIDVSRT